MRRGLLLLGGVFILVGVTLLGGATVGFDRLGVDRSGGIDVPADEDAYFGIFNEWGGEFVLNEENDHKYEGDEPRSTTWDEYEDEQDDDDDGLLSGLVNLLIDVVDALLGLILDPFKDDDYVLVYDNVTIEEWHNQFGEPIRGEVTYTVTTTDEDGDTESDSDSDEFHIESGETLDLTIDIPCDADNDNGEQVYTKYDFEFDFEYIEEDADDPDFEITELESDVTVICEKGGATHDEFE